MLFSFNEKSSTLLIFFIHGIVFSILLLYKGVKSRKQSNYWLALYSFLCSMYIAPFMFGYAGWYSKAFYRNILFYIPFQQLFLMPPVLYFYVKNLFNDNFKFQKKDWLHFAPAIIYLVYSIIIWITDQLVLKEYYFYANGRDKDLDLWYQIAGFIMMFFYLIISLRLYRQYRKNTAETVSFADSILLPWVQRFLTAFLFLLIIRLLFFILNPEWGNFGSKFWYYLTFSILFYYISLSGFVQAIKAVMPIRQQLNFDQSLEEILQTDEMYTSEATATPTQNTSPKVVYDPELKDSIEQLMSEKKLFKNPALTLFDIAQTLQTHPKKISEVINRGFNQNFNDFVNQYRILEVIEMVNSDKTQLKTLLGLAYDAGFNSKSTFNRAFKKQMNTTPKRYFQENGPKTASNK